MKDPFNISHENRLPLANTYRKGKLIPKGIISIAHSARCQEVGDGTRPDRSFQNTRKTPVGVGFQRKDLKPVAWVGKERFQISDTEALLALTWFETGMCSPTFRYFGTYLEDRATVVRFFTDSLVNECLRRHLKDTGFIPIQTKGTRGRTRRAKLTKAAAAVLEKFEGLLLDGFAAVTTRRKRERLQGAVPA